MADPKDNTSFFRKVVKFVASPSTDWAELGTPSESSRESEYAKSELKAMIERKRRNDFVRKREFDMLRRVRREGLTSDQVDPLSGSSRLDESDVRINDSGAKPDTGVKAKIDEIEQQMVGDGLASPTRRSSAFYDAPTQPAPLGQARSATPASRGANAGERGKAATSPARLPVVAPVPVPVPVAEATVVPPPPPPPPVLRRVVEEGALDRNGNFDRAAGMELTEVTHDADLDEAVIAFANADFETSEQSLAALTSPEGPRAQHAETWLALFDLYRAIGQQHKFECLANDYAQQFGWSAPQWFSMPKLVAEAASEDRRPRAHIEGQVGWVCPAMVDAEAVSHLRSQTLQMPLPWVFDWSALKSIDAEGSARLSELFRNWMNEPLDMRWLHGEILLQVLQDAAPTGVRDADPVFWQLRLDALRMANWPDQFDEVAIDYCVTYEVSPPSWEPATCQVRMSGSSLSTQSPSLSVISDAFTTVLDSQISEDQGVVWTGKVEISGQLVGDISSTLAKMNDELGSALVVNVSCARLIRVDFIAAGDLLNWVLARRAENRSVTFTDTHRLIALFFGAMGINEHARVKVRTV